MKPRLGGVCGRHNVRLRGRERVSEVPAPASASLCESRYHNEIKLTTPDEITDELLGWLRDAYTLG